MFKNAVCVVISLLLIFCSIQGYAQNKTIKIGCLTSLSDPMGIEGVKAMKLAVKQVNASGGLLGKQVELIVADDEMKPDKGVAAFEKLCTLDNVDIITGGYTLFVTMGLIPSMKKHNKIIMWSGVSTSKVEPALAEIDGFFHTMFWDYEHLASWENAWKNIDERYKTSRNKIFIIHEEGVFGSSSFKMRKEVSESFGREVQGASFKTVSVGGTGDYKAQLRKAKDFNPDQFILVGYDKDAIPLLEQAKEMNFKPNVFSAAIVTWPTDFNKFPLSNAITYHSQWNPKLAAIHKESKKFIESYQKEYNNETPLAMMAPLYYSNIMILADAIKRAGTIEKNELIKALEKTKYKSPMGNTFVFKPSKFIKYQVELPYYIMQWQNGVAEIIYPFEHATSKLIYPFTYKGK